MLPTEKDAYGHLLMEYQKKGEGVEIIEREDGFIDALPHSPAGYFAPFEQWGSHQQKAMDYVRGRVLDIGAGAGRVSLYLQERGQEVVAIDNSPLALEVCRLRGIKNTSLTSVTEVSRSRLGEFGTIVMMGNNFGLVGNRQRARWLLQRFYGMTPPDGRVVAESNDIYQTDNPVHLDYHQYNRDRGRMSGQIRLRVRHGRIATTWFDYLMVSPEEMREIAAGTGWHIVETIPGERAGPYVAVLEKESR